MCLEYEECLIENGASKREVLFDRVSEETLRKLIRRAKRIYYLKESSNLYGEFLFIGLLFDYKGEEIAITFYGLGYHEGRDRYFIDEWHFYWDANFDVFKDKYTESYSVEEVLEKIRERKEEIIEEAKEHKQSREGRIFEEIADLSDDDAALIFMEDYGGCIY